MTVITISRELGSEGDTIANLLCEQLGYCRVDKEMLSQIAEDAGVDVKAVLSKEQASTRRARLISSDMTSLHRKQPSAFEQESGLDDQTYARVLRETMERYAQEGNAVIVGRGGQMVLRDWPTALHVHLYASPEVRARRLMARSDISETEAKRQIERSDEQKRQTIRQMHRNANWKSMRYYDIAVNTGSLPPETAAKFILEAAQKKAQK